MAALLLGRSDTIERPYWFTFRVEIDLKFWMIAPTRFMDHDDPV